MQITQLDKTLEVVLAYAASDTEDVYFIRLDKFKTKSGSPNYTFHSKRLKGVALDEMYRYLTDSNYALIKVEV